MYDPMPTTDIALLLRHGMLYKKLVASVTKMLDHYNQLEQPDKHIPSDNILHMKMALKNL